jgi:hypothetical protein
MMRRHRTLALLAAAACALVAGGCATPQSAGPATGIAAKPAAHAVLRALPVDRATEDRILALDPERISADDVRTLARGPTPRIVLLHGGIYPVHMAMTSFGGFLTDMGYPEAKIRNPADESWSHSPYESSTQLAGLLAWYYEREGLRPMMIGHSQGGIQAVKVLRELDGAFGDRVPVRGPYGDAEGERTTFVDPVTGKDRPVIGLTVPYVSVVAAGGAALILPNQWNMVGNLRSIPNTVEDFTGYSLGLDLWAWSVPGIAATTEFAHNGTAKVRNVELPAWYNHVLMPITKDLASDPRARPWIEAYVPGGANGPVPLESEGESVLWAADVWHSVKKHWCLEAQRTIRARRALLGAG